MVKGPDYILFKPSAGAADIGRTTPASDKMYPLTEGVWQKEALDTMSLYNDGAFSPVGGAAEAQGAREPGLRIPHWNDFKFFADDTLKFARFVKGTYLPSPTLAPTIGIEKPADVATLTGGQLYDPAKTELKADQFPDRIIYRDGGLYPAEPKDDPAVAAQHANAPNYRQMPGKPIHGVGQPTEQGFQDVVSHVGGDGKPVVWTNTRAEAVVYVEGKPYNLRQLMSRENLDMKAGASGEEIETLEEQLKQKLLARGSVEISEEMPVTAPPLKDENGRLRTERVTRTVNLTADNCKTTRDVVDGLDPKIEYRRIPISDEKSPNPKDLDTIRGWMNEMKEKYPDADPQFVFNCHQGKGRTTTAMVTAGITWEGKAEQPFAPVENDAMRRAEENINAADHVQNLREVVDEYKSKAARAGAQADDFTRRAAEEHDPAKRSELEQKAASAVAERTRCDNNAREFTRRYAMMGKYSEYVCRFGADATTPSFDTWMADSRQTADLDQKWQTLNVALGLVDNQPQTALA